MTFFRLYLINRCNHITCPPELLDCANDAEVLAHAHDRQNALFTVEVWQGGRMVGRVPPL
jgi:hypothetical protein